MPRGWIQPLTSCGASLGSSTISRYPNATDAMGTGACFCSSLWELFGSWQHPVAVSKGFLASLLPPKSRGCCKVAFSRDSNCISRLDLLCPVPSHPVLPQVPHREQDLLPSIPAASSSGPQHVGNKTLRSLSPALNGSFVCAQK